MITLAPDVMAQAKAADAARKAGDTRPLLGIPIVAKDLMSTKDMPTTGGSRVFEGFQSTTDAWQIIKVKEAGAIVIGKANLAEYANDGHFSPSAYGQVWNAYDPSKSPIGSSGGTATAVASSLRRRGLRHADRRLAVGPVERGLASCRCAAPTACSPRAARCR